MNTISGNRVKYFDTNRELYHVNTQWPVREASTDQPSQEDFVLQIREANKEAEDTVDFLCRVTDIFCNTIFVAVCIVLLALLPGSMVSVGVKYLTDCPKQPMLPIYLLVGGCFGVLKLVGMFWKNIQMRRYQNMNAFYDAQDNDAAFASQTFKLMNGMLTVFLLGWQIAGSYWVFSIWEPNYSQLLHEPSNWCEKNVYTYAMIQIIGCYGLMGLGIIALVLLGVCYKYTLLFDT